MNTRTNRPVQFDITLTFKDRNGLPLVELVKYGFPTEPSALKVQIVARSIEQSILRTIPGLTFESYTAERV